MKAKTKVRTKRSKSKSAAVDWGDEDSIKAAVAKELDVPVEKVELDDDGRGFSSFGEGTFYRFEVGNKEYVVGENDDAVENLAIAVVKQDLESEPEIFDQSFLEQHIDKDRLRRDLHSDVWDSNYERLKEEEPEVPEKELNDLADSETEAQLKDPISYLEDIYGSEDAVKRAIEIAGIDVEDAAREAVSTDGAGHFLAHYDGNLHEGPGGIVYWRTN